MLWTALFVLCTLLINAPTLPFWMRVLGLDAVPEASLDLRRRAVGALRAHTGTVVESLRRDEDDGFAGVDWARVEEYAAVSEKTYRKLLGTKDARDGRGVGGGGSGRPASAQGVALFASVGRLVTRSQGAPARPPGALPSRRSMSSLHREQSMATMFLDTGGTTSRHDRVFGRPAARFEDEAGLGGAPPGGDVVEDIDVEAGLGPASDSGDDGDGGNGGDGGDGTCWEDVNELTIDGVPFLPRRTTVPGGITASRSRSKKLADLGGTGLGEEGAVAGVGGVATAEEGGGGKIIMLDAGVFDELSMAMMVHPWSFDRLESACLAVDHFDVIFSGRTAHASAAPSQGINAGDAMVIAQVAIGLLRQQLPPGDQVHGIVTNGGEAANVIPAHVTGRFMCRSTTAEGLLALIPKVHACFEAGALASGASVSIERLAPLYTHMEQDAGLLAAYRRHAEAAGRSFPADDAGSPRPTYSTDMANVSLAIPSIHPLIDVESGGAVNHQPEFTAACVGRLTLTGLLASG